LVKSLSDPLNVPYYPRIGVNESRRGAAGRNVSVYLALYRHEEDPTKKQHYQKLLMDALRNWNRYAGDLYVNHYKMIGHFGPDRIADYYFAPSTPYVAASLFELLKNGNLTEQERDELGSLKSQIKDILLLSIGNDGLVRSINDNASQAYTNPLIGLALLPFTSEEDCGKDLPLSSILHTQAVRESPSESYPHTGMPGGRPSSSH